jgi:hypothetical protein
MEMEKITMKIKQMQKTMKADKMDNVVLDHMLKEALKAKTEQEAERFWASIRTYCKTIENSPFTVNRSNLPVEVQEVLNSIKEEVHNASIIYFDAIGLYLRKHGKSGGGLFASADEYANMMGNMTYRNLRKEYNDKDASFDGTLATLPALPIVEDSQ